MMMTGMLDWGKLAAASWAQHWVSAEKWVSGQTVHVGEGGGMAEF